MNDQDPPRDDPGAAPTPAPPETSFAWTPDLAAGRTSTGEPAVIPPRSRRSRIGDVVIWVAALVVTLGMSIVIGKATDPSTPSTSFDEGRRAGAILGRVLGALVIAFIIWAPIVWLTRRRGARRRLLSPIVPLLAVIVLSLNFVSAVSKNPGAFNTSTARTYTLDDVLVIGPPYHLERSPADEEQQLVGLLRNGGGESLRSVDVRRVYSGTNLTGLILVADAQIAPNQDAVALAGFELGAGDDVTKRRVKVEDHDALVGTAGGAGYVAWVEAPFIEMVFADSETTANDLAIAFLRD